ncbi:MAG: hypothetical protein LBG69_07300 [Zoogloeaceae bacterium]|jgi:hypothetical protein|nr:hypothetical protein [Zoogloeaceae bacterium]
MVKKVILHLGHLKTGTTSIQETLFENSDILQENGFYYLAEWMYRNAQIRVMEHIVSVPGCRSMKNLNNMASESEMANVREEKLAELARVMQVSQCDTLIISAEIVWSLFEQRCVNLLQDLISKHFSGVEVKILLFVRNPLHYYISLYQHYQRMATFNDVNTHNCDYCSQHIYQYVKTTENIRNYFGQYAKFIKFEDAVKDSQGLVSYYLKSIDFPAENLQKLKIIKSNEASCQETMDFLEYASDKKYSGRYYYDARFLGEIKGTKYDLAYPEKLSLWNSDVMQDAVRKIQEITGIDYSDYTETLEAEREEARERALQETWRQETIDGFIAAFPKLSPTLQKLFLEFFQYKYAQTANAKFKQLYFVGSLPRDIWNALEKARSTAKVVAASSAETNVPVSRLSWKIKRAIKKPLQWVLYRLPERWRPFLRRTWTRLIR